MARMTKLIHSHRPVQVVAAFGQDLYIPGEGSAVAADVDDTLWLHF